MLVEGVLTATTFFLLVDTGDLSHGSFSTQSHCCVALVEFPRAAQGWFLLLQLFVLIIFSVTTMIPFT